MTTVHIIGPTFNLESVFRDYGFIPVIDRDDPDPSEVDIACWTGGEDINPNLYNQKPIPKTYFSKSRDERELDFYKLYKSKPKLGVCRGGQLLNVLNGGSMYQDIDGHRHGTHHVVDTVHGKSVIVCSVHHQLMIPSEKAVIVAYSRISTYRKNDKGTFYRGEEEIDPEVIWIPEDKALCFQAHPEFGPKSCTDYFFELVNRYIMRNN